MYKTTPDEDLKKWLLGESLSLIEKEPKISLFSSFVYNFDVLISSLALKANEYVQLYLKLIDYLQKHLV